MLLNPELGDWGPSGPATGSNTSSKGYVPTTAILDLP
jgi:hypothetical protein